MLPPLSNFAPRGFELSCTDGSADVLGLIDPSIAPAFLYYAYMPIMFLVLFIVFWVSRSKGESSIQKTSIFWIGIIFVILIGIDTFLWISIPVYLTHFAWQITAALNVILTVLISWFAYGFIYNDNLLPRRHRFILLGIITPILVLTPTRFNLLGFDLTNCESIQSSLWAYIYAVEASIGIVISILGLHAFMRAKHDPRRKRFLIFGLGTLFFMLTKVLGDIIAVHNVNLLWPLGMLVFLGMLAYLVIEYKSFEVRIMSTQVWVATLIFFIFAALFVRTIDNVRIILVATLALAILIGVFLVRSVRREIEQRQQLEQLNVRLKELDQQKNEFLHMASHQLRTPVTSIAGYASMIQSGELGEIPETAQPYLTKIMIASKIMNETVNDYLNIARIEDGSIEYRPENFSLAQLVKELAENIRINAQKRNLTFTVRSLEAIEGAVYADKMSLTQVINALLENAIKYTKQGEIVVSGAYDAVSNQYSVSVKDSGIGVAPEDIHTLFHKFSRTKNAKEADVFGTGMGLYIAKGLMEANKGTITATSEGLNKGSTFTISLPKAA